MIPVYLDTFYKYIKTVYTIHNIQYQGKYGTELIGDVLGLPENTSHIVEYDGCVNLMKGAIECADRVTTVSPTYAEEIKEPWFAHGLDGIIRDRAFKLCGIVNGIDTEVYDPENDPFIWASYSADDMSGKAINKAELQKATSP